MELILYLAFIGFDLLGYYAWLKLGGGTARGWKLIIPYMWIFA